MRLGWIISVLALVGSTTSCDALKDATGGDESSKSDEDEKDDEEEEEKEEEEEEGPTGMDHPDNDEEIVAGFEKVLDCEWRSSGLKYGDCEDYKTLRKSDSVDDGAGDETLVNLLEDDDEKVRWLAGRLLDYEGEDYREEEELGERVLAALEKEDSEMAGQQIARAAANIDAKETGLADDMIALAEEHDDEDVRRVLVSDMMQRNRKSDAIFEFTKKMAREAEKPRVRRAAASAFWVGTPRGKEQDVCALWLEVATKDDDPDVAGKGAKLVGQDGDAECEKQYDPLLDHLESRNEKGKVSDSGMVLALEYMHDQEDAEKEHRDRALELAKAIVKNEDNESHARATALRMIGEVDPNGKAIAKKYKEDDEFALRGAAKHVLKND